MNLNDVAKEIHEKFELQNQIRDSILGEIRKILKSTRVAIAALHRSEFKTAEKSILNARKVLEGIQSELAKLPSMPIINMVNTAEGELAEALLLLAFRKGNELPGPQEIGISDIGFLLGLGDFVGELRRVSIDALAADDFDLAKNAFSLMEDVYTILLTFDFPRGLTPGIKKKTDVARGLVERTRADISTEIQRRRLLSGIEKLDKSLKGS